MADVAVPAWLERQNSVSCLQQANAQNLAELAAVYAGFAGVPSASFENWTAAMEALLTVGDRLGGSAPLRGRAKLELPHSGPPP